MCAANIAEPVKFDFGETFDSLVRDEFDPSGRKEKAWTEDEVAQERAEAFAKGIEEGRNEALASLEQRIADANGHLLAKAQSFDDAVSEAARNIEDDACALALTLGRKIGTELLMQTHAPHIEALVSEALGLLTAEPHIVVRLNEDMVDNFKNRFETIAVERGYEGNLIILGERDIAEADCTIEWADGGISRNTEELETALDQLVKQHLQARGIEFDAQDHQPEAPQPGTEADDEGNIS